MILSPPKAIIFDMDGLLIDTESFWVHAQIEILRPLGVNISLDTCSKTKGLRIDEVVAHYHRQTPWDTPTIKETAKQIASRVSSLFQEKGVLMEGVHHALSIAHSYHVPVALASSSPHFLITELLSHSSILTSFTDIVSAEDDPYGKPHPSIYLRTAHMLGVHPKECMAIEDSFFGLLAAKSAQMNCIVVPDVDHPQWVIANHHLSSLLALTPKHFLLTS